MYLPKLSICQSFTISCLTLQVFPSISRLDFSKHNRGLSPTLLCLLPCCLSLPGHSFFKHNSFTILGANECLTRQTRLCYAHANNVCIYRRIENTEKHTLMLLHFIFFVMFLQAWKINTQNTHCGICGGKKLLFVFPWFLHDDDTVNYGFSCWQRDCGAQRERAINWWGICKQFTETMEQSGQLILTIPGLWPTTGASAPFLERGYKA